MYANTTDTRAHAYSLAGPQRGLGNGPWLHSAAGRIARASAAPCLPVGMAATNYAVEGATGELACVVCSLSTYAESLPSDIRVPAMRWLKVHAEYDDTHPWEALDIVATLLGHAPSAQQIAEIQRAIRSSYRYMEMALDHAMLAAILGAFDETASNASTLEASELQFG
jgi:hypothetical protein